jgi:hypothetical protein
MTDHPTTLQDAGALRCSGCCAEVARPGLCDACSARRAALRALSPEAETRRREKSLHRERTRREKVAAFALLQPEQQEQLLAQVRATRGAR